MISIVDAVKEAADRLKMSGIDNPEHDSFELLADIMGITRTDYFVRGRDEIPADIMRRYEVAVNRRCEHEPLQHITGKAWFYGRQYIVNSNVLVPRQDTEVLVEQVLKVINNGDRVLDMCTGSGCIITTIALERRLSKAVGVDLSKEALKVAADNVCRLKAEVELINSDLFEGLKIDAASSHKLFDVIVSNPPYIETEVIKTLSKEVKCFDPIMALDGFEDGLHFYRRITKEAKHFLKNNGWLAYEIGYNQAEAVTEIMYNHCFEDVRVYKDYAGLDRVVMGKKI